MIIEGRITFLFILISLLFSNIHGQNSTTEHPYSWYIDQIDSLDHHGDIGDSSWVYENGYYLLDWAQKNQEYKLVGQCFNAFALLEKKLSRHRLAIIYCDSAYHYYKMVNDTSGIIRAINNIADPLASTGNCTRAINGFREVYPLLDKQKKPYIWIVLKSNEARAFSFCNEFEACIQVVEESLPFAEKEKQLYLAGFLCDLGGYSYIKLGKPNEGIPYFSRALEISREIGSPDMESSVYNNIGEAYLEMKAYQKAYQNYKKSLLVKGQSNYALMSNGGAYANIGLASYKLGKFDESVAYFDTALTKLSESENFVFLAEVYEAASKAYFQADQHEKAYVALDQSKQWQDSVFNLEIQKELKEITAKYENEKLTKELAESSLLIEKQTRKNQLYVALFTLLTLSGILSYFLILNRQKQQKDLAKRKQIELEYGLLRARMNPHFLFNSLTSIQSYFAQNQFALGNDYLTKFSKLIRRVLEQCNKSSISIEEEIETLKLYMELERLRLNDKFDYDIQIDEELETGLIQLPPLILQPFVENAIWHGISPKKESGSIWIKMNLGSRYNIIDCNIRDNGIGLSGIKKDKHNSKGIAITRERLGKEGDVSILPQYTSSGAPCGVEVQLKIPIVDH